MLLVAADHGCFVAALVAQFHFNAPVGALYHVIVGKNVASLVEDESRTLPFLRHRSIKKVEDHRTRRDVDYRGQHTPVNGDVVLLLRVECGRSLRLCSLQRRGLDARTRQRQRIQPLREMSGDKPESTDEEKDQNKLAQFHSSL